MKKRIIHQIYLSLYLANLLFFSLFVSYLSLSQSYFSNSSEKVIFGGPTKYTKKLLHSGIVSTVFCLIPGWRKKYKREINIFGALFIFLVSQFFFESPAPISCRKKEKKNLENIYYVLLKKKKDILTERKISFIITPTLCCRTTVQSCLGLPDI